MVIYKTIFQRKMHLIFFAESCFGIVFPEIESLKSYQDKLNGYDLFEIPLNYHGPFLDSEDNGMRTFPHESYGNFVTDYLAYIVCGDVPHMAVMW